MQTVTIATLGTSLTAYSQPWQTMLAHKLRQGTGKNVVVYDFGISGASSALGLANLAKPLHVRPDIVSIEYTINDSYSPYGISVAQSKTNTLALISAFKANDPDVKLFLTILNPPVAGQPTDTARPNYPAYKAMYADLVAADSSLTLLDCSAAWGSPTLAAIPDGLHPPLSSKIQYEFPVTVPAFQAAF